MSDKKNYEIKTVDKNNRKIECSDGFHSPQDSIKAWVELGCMQDYEQSY